MAHIHTKTLTVDPFHPDPAAINQASEVIQVGGLVAFPTETVYGLGANALDSHAVARIFEAKGRPSYNPLIVHIPDKDAARDLVQEWTETAERLADRFWAGALTLVLKKSNRVPDMVTGGGDTVALRVPAHPVAQALLKRAGVPIAAPSANRSNQLSPTLAAHVAQGLTGRIEMILDGGATTGGVESTVLSLVENPPRLLRPGLITPSEIAEVIGAVQVGAEAPVQSKTTPLLSPGMLARHYAPQTPLIIAQGDGAEEVSAFLRQGLRVGWLTFHPQPPQPNLYPTLMPSTAEGYASRLFAELHLLDGIGVDRIVVAETPRGGKWLAIEDRLRRASLPTE